MDACTVHHVNSASWRRLDHTPPGCIDLVIKSYDNKTLCSSQCSAAPRGHRRESDLLSCVSLSQVWTWVLVSYMIDVAPAERCLCTLNELNSSATVRGSNFCPFCSSTPAHQPFFHSLQVTLFLPFFLKLLSSVHSPPFLSSSVLCCCFFITLLSLHLPLATKKMVFVSNAYISLLSALLCVILANHMLLLSKM